MGTPPVWRQAIITIRPRRDPPLSRPRFLHRPALPLARSSPTSLSSKKLHRVWRIDTAPARVWQIVPNGRRVCSSRYVHLDSSDIPPRMNFKRESLNRKSKSELENYIRTRYSTSTVPSVKYFEIVSSVRFACIKGERLRIVSEVKQVQRE